ncbi:MAG: PIG-L family deacetylase [Phycisphaeraceae bacterium]|nr:PIG-L family deacetylase [Phycisphaeraceae bacterium]
MSASAASTRPDRIGGVAPDRRLNILVVGPHPDDQEIGMGGTIARLADQGHNVLLLDVTDGSPTPRGDRASRLLEAASALVCLQPSAEAMARGARAIRRVLLDLPNRTVTHSVESRHAVAGVIRAHQAEILFAPQWEDAHPDHLAVTRIVEDARFDAKLTRIEMPAPPAQPVEYGWEDPIRPGPPIYPRWLFYYDVSHLRRVARPDFCFDITGCEERKRTAIRAYRSQFGPWDDEQSSDTGTADRHSPGDPKSDPSRLVSGDFPDRMLAYAAFWGSRIGTRFAEPFFTREPVGLGTLSGLIA